MYTKTLKQISKLNERVDEVLVKFLKLEDKVDKGKPLQLDEFWQKLDSQENYEGKLWFFLTIVELNIKKILQKQKQKLAAAGIISVVGIVFIGYCVSNRGRTVPQPLHQKCTSMNAPPKL